jgi:hypothetical protein
MSNISRTSRITSATLHPQLAGTVNAMDMTKPAWQARLDALHDAGIAEQAFLRAFDDLRNDHAIKKPDLIKIAEAYVGFVEKKSSVERIFDAIKTRFYGKLYDHDANEMAKRATPW